LLKLRLEFDMNLLTIFGSKEKVDLFNKCLFESHGIIGQDSLLWILRLRHIKKPTNEPIIYIYSQIRRYDVI